jgi:signal peptidase II
VKKEALELAMYLVIVFIALAVDQVTKVLVVTYLQPGESVAVWPPIFYLTYIKNPGGAFGVLAYHTEIFIILAVIFIVVVLAVPFYLSASNLMLSTCLGLLTGGVLGNLLDRLRTGYVIDFLDFRVWPIFNAADVFILVGALLLILFFMEKGS